MRVIAIGSGNPQWQQRDSEQQHEIGVRMAVGADRPHVLRVITTSGRSRALIPSHSHIRHYGMTGSPS
jgi:hypothetical protein